MAGIVADLAALRQIALMGAVNGFVEVSSSELGSSLGVSQQTASRRMRDLEELGYLRREMGVHRQLVRVTEEGMATLRNEFTLLHRIFDLKDKLTIEGVVASGLGEGAYYIAQPRYTEQFEQKLGFRPFPGTLNLEVHPPEVDKIRILKSTRPVQIAGFEDRDRTYGAVEAWQAALGDYGCAVILPIRTHHTRTIEIIAPDNLRERFRLKDGDKVQILVRLANGT